MNARLNPGAKQLIDTVLKLADAFGLTASVYTTAAASRTVCWRQGSFVSRRSSVHTSLTVSVVTSAGAIGRVTTDDWSIAAAVRAFHLARKEAVHNPLFLAQLSRLNAREARALPPAPALDRPDKLPAPFFREVERYHRQLQRLVAPQQVGTTCTVRCEQIAAGRSDGSLHQATIWRAECLDEWHDPHSFSTRRLFACFSAPAAALLSVEQLTAPSLRKLRFLKRHKSVAAADWRQSLSEPQLLLDSEVTAALLFAAFLSGTIDEPPPTAAVISLEPSEGIPGYHPLHPYGYLLAPAIICSARRSDPSYVQALRNQSNRISSHLSLRLPRLANEARDDANPAEVCRRLAVRGLAGELSVLAGINRFHYDADSGLFALLPQFVFRWRQGRLTQQAPCWLYSSFASWLSGCLGGAGPAVLEWPQPGLPWTVSVPQYTLTQVKEDAHA